MIIDIIDFIGWFKDVYESELALSDKVFLYCLMFFALSLFIGSFVFFGISLLCIIGVL
jgi:hypothetical protein